MMMGERMVLMALSSEHKPDRGYAYADARPTCAHRYLVPALLNLIASVGGAGGRGLRLFDLGCGSGAVAKALADRGYDVTGVDPSEDGIRLANAEYPSLGLGLGSAYDDLAGKFGTFPVVYSLEVVEHVYYPRKFAKCLFDLVEPGGVAIVSTPYNGYLKNLAIALAGGFDRHATALWDNGHIKFWSIRTLRTLLEEAGFTQIEFRRVGRFAPLAKSMIAVAHRR